MRDARGRMLSVCLIGLLSVVVGGCAVAADLINPALFEQLGLDASIFKPTQGVVLVVFNNTTGSTATFYAYSAKNAANLTQGSRNFSVTVPNGEVRNEAVECPIDVISPGQIGDTGGTAANVNDGGTNTTVTYAGGALFSGTSFQCGDVIEVRLVQTATGTANAFEIRVRVIPGQ